MKDVRSTGSRKMPAVKAKKGNGGVPFAGAVIIALCTSGGAYWVGDRAGYARGTHEAVATGPNDPFDKMDCMAKVHRVVTAPKAEPAPVKPLPPPPPAPVDYSFHKALKGGATQKVVRPADPLTVSSKTFVSAAPVEPKVQQKKVEEKQVEEKKLDEKPAGLSNAPATGEYTLQVGAFPNKDDALRVFDKLKAAGLKPSIAPSEVAGNTWYRVRVGRFADRASAESASAALHGQVQLNGVPARH